MHQINSTLKQDLLLTRIMEATRQVVNSEASSLMMLDGPTQELTIHIPTGPVKGEISGKKVPPGQGIAGWVTLHNQPLILEDAKNDPRHYTGIDTESGFETRSLICVPLKNSDGEVIGVMEALNKAWWYHIYLSESEYLSRLYCSSRHRTGKYPAPRKLAASVRSTQSHTRAGCSAGTTQGNRHNGQWSCP